MYKLIARSCSPFCRLKGGKSLRHGLCEAGHSNYLDSHTASPMYSSSVNSHRRICTGAKGKYLSEEEVVFTRGIVSPAF
jgi:hypothetical protein